MSTCTLYWYLAGLIPSMQRLTYGFEANSSKCLSHRSTLLGILGEDVITGCSGTGDSKKAEGVDFFVCSCPCLCPPPAFGESTSDGKVLHTASQSLLDNPLSGNQHCLQRANLPIVMPPRAVHIQSRVDSSISDPGSAPQFRKAR